MSPFSPYSWHRRCIFVCILFSSIKDNRWSPPLTKYYILYKVIIYSETIVNFKPKFNCQYYLSIYRHSYILNWQYTFQRCELHYVVTLCWFCLQLLSGLYMQLFFIISHSSQSSGCWAILCCEIIFHWMVLLSRWRLQVIVYLVNRNIYWWHEWPVICPNFFFVKN